MIRRVLVTFVIIVTGLLLQSTLFWDLKLLGVRPELGDRLVAAGHRLRIYVPYGTQWYAYLMRRLAERPANLAFLGRALRSRT